MNIVRRVVYAFLIFLIVFIVAFVSGPIIGWDPEPTTTEVALVEQAGDLDKYLSDFEALVKDVKPELVRGIVWADSSQKARTPLSIVYIHGFSASRKEMYPVWDRVAKELGANLYYARVKAHGLADGEAFGELSAQDFIDEGRVALAIGRKLGEKVVLVGMSTGAEIVLHLANENREASDLHSLILVSPNHMPAKSMAKFISGPLGPMWAKLLLGSHRSFPTMNDAHAKYWTPRYRSESIPAMMDLVNSSLKIDLSLIKVPVLTLYTKHDQVVNTIMIETRHHEFGSEKKRIIDLPQATRHEFASEAVAPEAVDATVAAALDFLK